MSHPCPDARPCRFGPVLAWHGINDTVVCQEQVRVNIAQFECTLSSVCNSFLGQPIATSSTRPCRQCALADVICQLFAFTVRGICLEPLFSCLFCPFLLFPPPSPNAPRSFHAPSGLAPALRLRGHCGSEGLPPPLWRQLSFS